MDYEEMAWSAKKQTDWTAARRWYLKLLAAQDEEGETQADTCKNIGDVSLAEEHFEDAGQWFVLAIHHFQMQNHYAKIVDCLLSLEATYARCSADQQKTIKRYWDGFEVGEEFLHVAPAWRQLERLDRMELVKEEERSLAQDPKTNPPARPSTVEKLKSLFTANRRRRS